MITIQQRHTNVSIRNRLSHKADLGVMIYCFLLCDLRTVPLSECPQSLEISSGYSFVKDLIWVLESNTFVIDFYEMQERTHLIVFLEAHVPP